MDEGRPVVDQTALAALDPEGRLYNDDLRPAELGLNSQIPPARVSQAEPILNSAS